MDDKKKRALAILSAIIACILIALYSLKNVQIDTPQLDPWIAPADQIRPWAENKYNLAMKPSTPSHKKIPLSADFKVTHTSENNSTFTCNKRLTPSLPNKIIHTKPENIIENLYLSLINSPANEEEYRANIRALFPEKSLPPKDDYQYLPSWKFIRILNQDIYTRLPIIALHPNKSIRNNKLKQWQIFDSRTHVNLAENREFFAEVAMLHPSPVTIVIDIMEDAQITAPLAAEGEITDIGNFQCKLITTLHRTRTWSVTPHRNHHGIGWNHQFTDEPHADPSEKFHYLYIEWSNPNLARFSSLKITTNDNLLHPIRLHQEMGHVAIFSTQISPSDIKHIEISTQPYFTRYITELEELPGMPEINRGVTNLFDVTIPNYHQSNSPFDDPPYIVTRIVQLETRSISCMNSANEKETHVDLKVRQHIKNWENANPQGWFQMHSKTLTGEFHQSRKPQPTTIGQKYFPEWLR